jgi:hypothetical protein
VGIAVDVGKGVAVGVTVGVAVGENVAVGDNVAVGVLVGVCVGRGVHVGVCVVTRVLGVFITLFDDFWQPIIDDDINMRDRLINTAFKKKLIVAVFIGY